MGDRLAEGLMRNKELVEAAGVEPASEKACLAKTTCVAGSKVSITTLRASKKSGDLVRLISTFSSGPKPAAYPEEMTLTDRHSGLPAEAHYLMKLGSVCKLLVIGSCMFPIVLRELGTRHAFTLQFNPVEAVTPPGLVAT
jgi:hypothetical protein